MSLLGNIVSKILHPFGGGQAEAAPSGSGATTSSSGATSTPAPTGSAGTGGGEPVDVAAVLTGLAEKNPQIGWC